MQAAGLTERTLTLGPDTVHFWEGGARASPQAPTLVFVQGFGADALWQWVPQAESFARRHRVLVPDLLWFGGSSSTSRDFSLDHQARALLALLDRLEEARVQLVGISYGGLVSFQLAAAAPDRVARLVLVDSPGCAYRRADLDALLARFGKQQASDLFVPRTEADVDQLMALAYEDPPWVPGFAKRQVLAQLYGDHRDEKVALLDTLLASLDARPACERTARPTLLIWGRGDPVFPLEIGERLARALGEKATLEVIDAARHAPNLEHPERFDALLAPFLEAPVPPSPTPERAP
jgi:pimeloyl-ACP methyl ester carboxylesterase